MWTDIVIEETRKTRNEYAAKFNYDLNAIYEDLKKQEQQNKERRVSVPPKEPIAVVQKKKAA